MPIKQITHKKYRSTTIIGDSIIKDIKTFKIKRDIPAGDKIYVKSFSGATIADLTHHVKPSVSYNPDLFIIHGGSNDLRSKKSPDEIAQDVINLATDIKTQDNEVMVSGIVFRSDKYDLNAKGRNVNKILMEKCAAMKFYYIDNSNVNKFHLNGSGLHLNFNGTKQLANNFLDCILL